MSSADKTESKELTPDQKATRDQIRGILSRTSDPRAHYASEEGHHRALLLNSMPSGSMSTKEEEELHFRNLMERKRT